MWASQMAKADIRIGKEEGGREHPCLILESGWKLLS